MKNTITIKELKALLTKWESQGLIVNTFTKPNVYRVRSEKMEWELDDTFEVAYEMDDDYDAYEVEGTIFYFYWVDPAEV